MQPKTVLSRFPNEGIRIRGDLLLRLLRNYDRLEGTGYTPAEVFIQSQNNIQWPGDYPGRTILALSNLQRVTGRPAKHLNALLEELPKHFNEQGYMGPVFSHFDEQQLSGHGWLISGLIAAHRTTGNSQAAEWAKRIVENLFLPLRGRFSGYPIAPEQRSNREGAESGTRSSRVGDWQVSTDIGCAFIGMEGLVSAYLLWGDQRIGELILEMLQVFERIDLLAISAQLHASLTAARLLLMSREKLQDSRLQQQAQRVYELFRAQGMTENYANYNWFNRPDSWTEPCAIVDSLIVAFGLWQNTGDSRYLDDAHAIYFNALGYAQKPHGGFGCDNCAGVNDPFLLNKVYDVSWCCNMRGAVGLSFLADHAYLKRGDDICLPFLFDSSAELDCGDGVIGLTQTTGYPRTGTLRLEITRCTLGRDCAIEITLPTWVDPAKVSVHTNRPAVHETHAHSLSLRQTWHPGDVIEVAFPIPLLRLNPINIKHQPGRKSLRHGSLILGLITQEPLPAAPDELGMQEPGTYRDSAGRRYSPLNDVISRSENDARTERVQILF